jgi:hypothetical protein
MIDEKQNIMDFEGIGRGLFEISRYLSAGTEENHGRLY